MTNTCTFLEWDSQFFGYRIGRVEVKQIYPQIAHDIDDWAENNSLDLVYFLSSSDHPESTQTAELFGYHLRDIRVTLQQKLSAVDYAAPKAPVMRHYQNGDLEHLVDTVRTAYTQSRFYFDPHFSDEQCAELYEVWLQRSCETDYADGVVIAEYDGKAAAYVTCHLDNDTKIGKIGLVGVVEAARGYGLGRHLVNYALEWFWQQGMEQVTVVTQGRNVGAQRLYQRCGFVTQSVQLWYHKWFNQSDE